ncbi:MAG: MFS transporter [Gammaproteobacteria bacterium]|nr:MFS transporter [Gammaproteobacteria bacterium]
MARKVFPGWWVVLAAGVGLATGVAAINVFAFGVFQQPLIDAFGWSRTEIALTLLLVTVVTVFTSPFVGSLVDLHGVRRVALPSIVLMAAALASLYWLTPNLWHFYLVYALMPILGGGTSSVAYARAITRWFDRRRGLALGVALAGVGVGGMVIPRLTQALIDAYGWRLAYVGLAVLCVVVTLPVAALFLRDSPEERGLAPDGDVVSPAAAAAGGGPVRVGLDRAGAMRTRRFWLLIGAFLVLGVAIGGVMLQLIPILRARGVDATTSAGILSLLGASSVVGRIGAGYLVDRFHAPHVAIGFLLGPILGVALLATGATGYGAAAAAILVGLAAGAEVDVLAYLVGRYFGTRSYAELYGYQYSMWTLGSGFGPLLTAIAYDRLGGYEPALWAYVGCFVVACVMLARLGPYPRFDLNAR